MQSAKPTLAFAVIGQARADGAISPQQESQTLGELLTLWAVRDATGRINAASSLLKPIGSPLFLKVKNKQKIVMDKIEINLKRNYSPRDV